MPSTSTARLVRVAGRRWAPNLQNGEACHHVGLAPTGTAFPGCEELKRQQARPRHMQPIDVHALSPKKHPAAHDGSDPTGPVPAENRRKTRPPLPLACPPSRKCGALRAARRGRCLRTTITAGSPVGRSPCRPGRDQQPAPTHSARHSSYELPAG
jgi:hypothetical protein